MAGVLVVATGGARAAALQDGLKAPGSWTYQLQGIDPRAIAATTCDLAVIDYSADGSAEKAFSADVVASLKRKPDGSRRTVLAYLSIGEGEDYRFYWRQDWAASPPAWLKGENPDWAGNFAVRYWDKDWQALIFGKDDAYLDRIMAAGFDGVYLDRVDAFDVRDATLAKPARVQAMVDFVVGLADYARARHPDFVIVAQNGEELLANADYVRTIDGLAKEDLFYGTVRDGKRNSSAEIAASVELLARLQATAKPLLVAEYLVDGRQRAKARVDAAALGATLFVGDRGLDHDVPC